MAKGEYVWDNEKEKKIKHVLKYISHFHKVTESSFLIGKTCSIEYNR